MSLNMHKHVYPSYTLPNNCVKNAHYPKSTYFPSVSSKLLNTSMYLMTQKSIHNIDALSVQVNSIY
jgi:hypothetical protein